MGRDRILMGNPAKLDLVWSRELREELGLGEAVTKDQLLAEPESFRQVRYLFSTWGMPHFTKEEIQTCLPSLEAVFYGAGSVQAFAREFLELGITVCSAWAANAVPVAEYTVAQITLAAKGYFAGERRYRQTRDKRLAARLCETYPGNYHITVGLIGCGMIGSMVARALSQRAYRVLVFDPFLSSEKQRELGVIRVETLDELFGSADIVSNHAANNPNTVGMIQGCHFSEMKSNATFINTGRGAQIVEGEMIDVLRARPDLNAILDVTYPEPPVPESPLYSLPNVWLTPHIAGSLSGECVRMAEYMRDEYLRFVRNEPVKYNVTLQMLETMA